ncbi:MAG: hypothetical protein GX428_06810 [Candidatus Atribacteria bacterium]|nr:hypothetical protein [Candidatus Atribacteria bacterium]
MDILSSPREKRIRDQKRKFRDGFGFIWIIIFIYLFQPTVEATEILKYSIVSRDLILGEMIYEIETTNQEVLFRSFFTTNQNEDPQKDIELVINRENLTPILSKKWLKISEGEIIIEAQYNQERVNVILISPYGRKEVSLKTSLPTYDMEQVFFLPGLENTGNFQERLFPVLIPASGMIWSGKIMKIDEDEKSIHLKYTLAGEILFLQYEKAAPYRLLTMKAPNRGYDLILKE